MKETKLIEVISSFSYKEMKRLDQYIHSSFLNNNKKATQLFELLLPLYPEFEISKETLFRKMFGNQPFQYQKLRYVMSDLTKLVEAYLAQIVFEEKKSDRQQYLMQWYLERDHDKYFQQTNKLAKDQLKLNPEDAEFFRQQLLVNEENYTFTSTRNNRAIDTSLQQLSENIDHYYLSNKLKYSCEIINRMNILSVEYDTKMLDTILQHLTKNPPKDIPAVHIYYTILLTLKESNNEEHYFYLKQLLQENITNFSTEEMRDMYTYLQNYCIKKANQGNSNYLNELFDSYKTLLESELIYRNGVLAQFDFKNIVTVSLRLNEFEWTNNFIESKHKKLREEFRENAYTYNKARLYFGKEEYSRTLKLLLGVEFTDVYYHIDSKALLLKTYYELEEIEPLMSLFLTFKMYLKRNKQISAYQRTIYNNLIHFTKKLIRLKLGRKITLQEIRKEIEIKKQIADSTWLISKVEELEQNE